MNAPMQVKGYELQERIGNGGFGAVYRAVQSTVGREVAIKIILPHFASHPDFIRRFETEAQTIARLEHMNIIPLYDYWRDPEGAYLVMRYLRGGSLSEALKDGAYALPAAVYLLEQIASALAIAHRSGVIHRDIKPGNILLDEDGNAYLADFGIAKDLTTPKNGDMTGVDAIVGSLDYISPEQARSEAITPRTDIYSLGVVMYELLTGQHPFPNLSSVERMYKHISEPLPLMTNLPPHVVDGLNRVIQKATEKNPALRYGDVLSFAAEFRQEAQLTMQDTSAVEILTAREQQVLKLLIDGKSNRQIAEALVVEQVTVKWYLRQIYRKLGVRNRVQAIVRGRDLDLVVDTENAQPRLGDATFIISTTDIANPYKGLHAFQVSDEQDFFGREKIIEKLIQRLGAKKHDTTSRVLAVIGPSGSGKSSLVKAGLIPALWRGAIEGSKGWLVAEMIPGSRPLDELEISLTKIAGKHDGNLREHLERDEFGLVRVAQLILPDAKSELLLVIDQFEEVFTLIEDEARRVHFLNLLVAAATDKRSRVRVVVTLRADFYDRPLHYPQIADLIREHMETVLPLSAEELARAISKPAERVGVTFEEGLVPAIIGDVNYQAGALPLLQYALTELFERRTGTIIPRQAYQDIGKAVGALTKRADELYLDLNSEGQALAKQMFLRLVTLGEGTEDTRRRAERAELLALSANEDLMDEVIDTFAQYRLLALDNDPATHHPTVEVAHEAILREWERLRVWLNDSREDIKLQRRLATAAEAWEHGKRDTSYLVSGARLKQFETWSEETQLAQTPLEREFLQVSLTEQTHQEREKRTQQAREEALTQRARKVLQGLVAVFVVATIFASGLSIFAFSQQAKAQDAEKQAKESEAEANDSATIAATERDKAQRQSAEFRSIAMASGAQEESLLKRPQNAIALAYEAIQIDNPPIQSKRVFFNIASKSAIRNLLHPDAQAFDVRFLFDGQRFAANITGKRGVFVWDLAGNQLNHNPNGFGFMETHPTQPLVATTATDGLLLWNVDTNEDVILSIEEKGDINPLVFNADGSRLYTYVKGQIVIIDVATRSISQTIPLYDPEEVNIIEGDVSADEKYLVVASYNSFLTIWDTTTWETVQTLKYESEFSDSWVWDAFFIPNTPYILSGEAGGILRLWDWQANEIVWEVETERIQDIALSPDAQYFMVGHTDPTTYFTLHETQTGRLLRTYDGHFARTRRADFSPDGRSFVSSALDNTMILWDVWDEKVHEFISISADATFFNDDIPPSFATDGERVAYPNFRENTLEIRSIASGEILQTIPLVTEDYSLLGFSLSFSPTSNMLLFGFQDRPMLIHLDTSEVQALTPLPAELNPKGDINLADANIVFSPDGGLFAFIVGKSIIVYNTTTGEMLYELLDTNQDTSALYFLVFSPDSKRLYANMQDNTVGSWDLETGEFVGRLQDEHYILSPLTINAEGTILITDLGNRSLGAWDIQDIEHPHLIHVYSGHTDFIWSAEFSPDGRYLLSGSKDKNLILWDYATGEALRGFVGHTRTPLADFNSDGTKIVSASWDEVIIWDVPTNLIPLQDWVHENRYRAGFTPEQCELYELDSPECAE